MHSFLNVESLLLRYCTYKEALSCPCKMHDFIFQKLNIRSHERSQILPLYFRKDLPASWSAMRSNAVSVCISKSYFPSATINCFCKTTQVFHTKKKPKNSVFLFLKAGAIQTHLQHFCSREKKVIIKENEMKSLITTRFQGEKPNHLVSYHLLILATDAPLTYCTFGEV